MGKSIKTNGASEGSACHHPALDVDMKASHFADTNIHFLQVAVACKVCGRRMKFISDPVGPTTEPDACGISFPFVGEHEEPQPLPEPDELTMAAVEAIGG